jgi:hypothetical protein
MFRWLFPTFDEYYSGPVIKNYNLLLNSAYIV